MDDGITGCWAGKLGARTKVRACRAPRDRGRVWSNPHQAKVHAATCLNRTVLVKPLPDAADVVPLLAPVRAYLQTAALALDPARRDALADALGAAGVTRICPVGKMPDPDPAWHHDGRFNLLDLVRWVDIEEGYPL